MEEGSDVKFILASVCLYKIKVFLCIIEQMNCQYQNLNLLGVLG